MKKTLLSIGILVLVALVLVVGYKLGTRQGVTQGGQEIKNKLQPIVDLAFPKPPEEIFSLTGTVQSVIGATINLLVNDPDDYLPHTDGSTTRQETRFASLVPRATITLINFQKLDAQNNPTRTSLKLSDIKKDMTVTVTSNVNIRSLEKFDVNSVELVQY